MTSYLDKICQQPTQTKDLVEIFINPQTFKPDTVYEVSLSDAENCLELEQLKEKILGLTKAASWSSRLMEKLGMRVLNC